MSSHPQDHADFNQMSMSDRVLIVCKAFERKWVAGNRSQIEDHLDDTDEPERSTLLKELLALDVEYRRQNGETVALVDYTARFPGDIEVLADVFRQQPASDTVTVSMKPDAFTLPLKDSLKTLAPSSTPLPLPQIGPRTSFADYEVLEAIARGGMGVVYKARQKKLNRTVAIKMILAGRFASEQEVKRFYSEAEAAAKLDHPNIVPIYEVGQHQGQHYFSMGYIEGESLAAKVADGPLPPREAAQMVKIIAEAVQYAHEHGILHRDLKPANVLVDKTGQPRVADFGLAKILDAGRDGPTATGDVIGTPSYMPPEQAGGESEKIGHHSDVYSLGAILYCLLTGRPPFQAATQLETLLQVIQQEPVPPSQLNPGIGRDLDTICLKCLRKDSAKRYSTAAKLADDIGRWLEKKPIVARPVSRVEKAWLWCKRRPAVASLLVAIVVLGFVGTVVVKQREYQQEAESLVERLVTAETEDVPKIVAEMGPYWDAVVPILEQADDDAEKDNDFKKLLHVRLTLVRTKPSHVDYLFDRLLTAKVEEVPVIVELLSQQKERLREQLWQNVRSGTTSERIRAAAAQAEYDSKSEQWKQVCQDVVTALVSVPSAESDEWIDMLRPMGSVLVDPLEQRFKDRSPERDAERPLAALALADYLKDEPKTLIELLLLGDTDREFQPLLLALRNHRQSIVPELQTLLRQSPPTGAEPDERDSFWKKQANAAVCLLELGETEPVWPLFRQMPNPSLRSFIIDRLALLGANPATLSAQIRQASDSSSRYALVLALGQFDSGKMSSQQKQELVEQLAALYRDDPEPGVHSAAGWTLRNWQQEQVASEIDVKLRNSPPKQDCNWFVNSQGQTYIVVNGPVEFLMGENTEAKNVTLSHNFAMATHEVTVAQFQRYHSDHKYSVQHTPQSDCPVNRVTWYNAVAYCNWLSEQEGIPQDQWCYESNDQEEYSEGMKIAADYLERSGYRLPTEDEWEFVCQANSMNRYAFGEPLELLARYAWYSVNSDNHMWPVGTKLPNALGVFDMHGNAWEWCHNLNRAPKGQPDVVVKDNDRRLMRGGSFNRRPVFVRSARRNFVQTDVRLSLIGFRAARTYHFSP